MPLYTITTQAGVLDSPAKTDLADKLTAFHAEYAAVPKNWVHIVSSQAMEMGRIMPEVASS